MFDQLIEAIEKVLEIIRDFFANLSIVFPDKQ